MIHQTLLNGATPSDLAPLPGGGVLSDIYLWARPQASPGFLPVQIGYSIRNDGYIYAFDYWSEDNLQPAIPVADRQIGRWLDSNMGAANNYEVLFTTTISSTFGWRGSGGTILYFNNWIPIELDSFGVPPSSLYPGSYWTVLNTDRWDSTLTLPQDVLGTAPPLYVKIRNRWTNQIVGSATVNLAGTFFNPANGYVSVPANGVPNPARPLTPVPPFYVEPPLP
jgi:hypothetical protein